MKRIRAFVSLLLVVLLLQGGCTHATPSIESAVPIPECGAPVWQDASLHFAGCGSVGPFRAVVVAEGPARDTVSGRLEAQKLGHGYVVRAVAELPAGATSPVQILGLSISGGLADQAAATVHLTPVDRTLRQLANGFHIFSFAGVVSLPVIIDAQVDDPKGINLDADEIRAGTSWWWMGLRRDDVTAPTMFMGALDASIWRTFLAVNGDARVPELHIRSGFMGDPAVLRPGAVVSSSWVWIASARDWTALLQEYAGHVAEANQVPELPAPPSVWSSWHSDFDDIDEDIVAQRLDSLADADNGTIDLAQIDDGWQRRWGDWTHADTFPSGMTALAHSMSSRGYIPGLWVAPALIDEESETAMAHPEWLLRDAAGDTIRCTFCSTPDRNFGPIAVLDMSQSDVQNFVREIFEQLVAEGFRMFKIDFTLLAADPLGVAADGSTGMQRYRSLMEAIDDGTVLPEGGQAYRSVIGSPFLGPAGYAEATRFGPDLAYALVSEELPWESIKAQARNYGGRWFMANQVFTADLDAAYQRPGVPVEDVRTAVAVMSLAAGFYHIGDRVEGLDEERRAILFNPALRELMATMSAAVPLDMWNSGGTAVGITPAVSIFRGFEPAEGYPPSIWRAERAKGAVWYFFNWTEEDIRVPVGRYMQGSFTELWRAEAVHFYAHDVVTIPAHDVRIYWQ